MNSSTSPARFNKLGLLSNKLKQEGVIHTAKRAVSYLAYRARVRTSDYYRAYFLVPRMAWKAIDAVGASGKRGLFLDCGSNVGQGFEYFRKFFPRSHFDYELFEPNPNCLPHLEQARERLPDHAITIHNSAISTSSDWLNFYGTSEDEGGELAQGGSVLKEHNSGFYETDENKALRVRSIDFAEFIREKSKSYDIIVIKLDIEGGEYDVLEDLIEKNMLGSIHSVFCEFHSQYMKPEGQRAFRLREEKIEREVRRTSCCFVLWR